MQYDFLADWCSEDTCLQTIRDTYKQSGEQCQFLSITKFCLQVVLIMYGIPCLIILERLTLSEFSKEILVFTLKVSLLLLEAY